MSNVAKYNVYKGVSTGLTIGTPIITLACCGDMFVQSSGASISAAGVFTILILVLIFKDKIVENFKVPSALVVAMLMLVLIYLVENIITPIKYVCWATVAASGIDTFTFKKFYKQIELLLPEEANAFKHFGFLFTSNEKVEELRAKGSDKS